MSETTTLHQKTQNALLLVVLLVLVLLVLVLLVLVLLVLVLLVVLLVLGDGKSLIHMLDRVVTVINSFRCVALRENVFTFYWSGSLFTST